MNQVMENPSPASYLQNTNWLFRESKGTKWTAEENKRFENALAQFDKDTPDRWHRVAAMIPGKTAGDVWKQYKELEEDVSDIEAGLFPIPGYARNSFTLEWANDSHNINNNNYCHEFDGLRHFYSPGGKRGSSTRPSEQERKKGIPWTEEEHRQFLMGLKKYGKGDWRNISRNFVTSRTPTQVASHAQKYFIRQHTGGNKRRASIHDITTHNLPPDSNESSSRDGNKSPSPSRSTSTLQLPHHHHHEPSIRMTGFDNQKLQNRDQGSNSSNMFLAPFCGMSSYGQMFQEQNLLRATIGGAQFGPYSSSSTIYQMQSMQHQ